MGEKGNDPAAAAAGLAKGLTPGSGSAGNTGGLMGSAATGAKAAAGPSGASGTVSSVTDGLKGQIVGGASGSDQLSDIEAAIKAAGDTIPPPTP